MKIVHDYKPMERCTFGSLGYGEVFIYSGNVMVKLPAFLSGTTWEHNLTRGVVYNAMVIDNAPNFEMNEMWDYWGLDPEDEVYPIKSTLMLNYHNK